MVASDDWTKSAMRDGEMVAELLVSLKEAKVVMTTSPSPSLLFANPTVTALRWGIRRSRSRKEAENSRCSPSTPLSWSGGGSSSSPPSAYIDGYEATSRRICRSKVLVTADMDFDVKRLQSKKDIASLRSPFAEQGLENKKMKRMKMDLKNHSENLAENEDCKAGGNFLLPDLNIMPCEENSDHYSSFGVETTLYGLRIIR